MKKIFFTLITTMLIIIVNAQTRFGIKGGLSLANARVGGHYGSSNFDFDIKLRTKLRTSFYIGGLAEFSLRNFDRTKIQAEILYAQNGFKFDSPIEEVGHGTIKFSQLLVPIVGKYMIFDNFYLYGGSYLGFTLDVKENDDDGEGDYDDRESYTTFDSGLIAGAEYNLPDGFFIEGRYNFGLLNMINLVDSGAEVSYKNRFIQLGIGYKFK